MNFLWEGLFSGAMLVLGRVHRHKIMIHILRLPEVPIFAMIPLGNSRGDVYTCSVCLFFVFRLHLWWYILSKRIFPFWKKTKERTIIIKTINVFRHSYSWYVCFLLCFKKSFYRGSPCATKWDSRSFSSRYKRLLGQCWRIPLVNSAVVVMGCSSNLDTTPQHNTSWWFQPIWKIWVKLDHFPRWGWKWIMSQTTTLNTTTQHTTPTTTNLPTNQPTQPIKSSKKTQAIPPINTQKKNTFPVSLSDYHLSTNDHGGRILWNHLAAEKIPRNKIQGPQKKSDWTLQKKEGLLEFFFVFFSRGSTHDLRSQLILGVKKSHRCIILPIAFCLNKI